MNKKSTILLITDQQNRLMEEISIIDKNYILEICSVYNEISKLDFNVYKYIIIDLEFNDRQGDLLCEDLRRKYKLYKPIIGILGNYKGFKNKNYIYKNFNNIETLPILNWQNTIESCYREFIWDKWLNSELNYSNYIFKKNTKKKPYKKY